MSEKEKKSGTEAGKAKTEKVKEKAESKSGTETKGKETAESVDKAKVGADSKSAEEPTTREESKEGAESKTGADESRAGGKVPEGGLDYKEPRFMDIVFSVSAGALQGLGLGITTPDGKKPEPNLDLARYSIDMLELLKVKTEGKLEGEEKRFLDEMLHSLRLKYLEVANQAKEAQ